MEEDVFADWPIGLGYFEFDEHRGFLASARDNLIGKQLNQIAFLKSRFDFCYVPFKQRIHIAQTIISTSHQQKSARTPAQNMREVKIFILSNHDPIFQRTESYNLLVGRTISKRQVLCGQRFVSTALENFA
jgi:hypothetical protein